MQICMTNFIECKLLWIVCQAVLAVGCLADKVVGFRREDAFDLRFVMPTGPPELSHLKPLSAFA